MKPYLRFYFIPIAFLFLFACGEDEMIQPYEPPAAIKKVDDETSFRILVRGENKLDIRLNETWFTSGKLFITTESDTTELTAFSPQLPNFAYLTANLEYNFSQDSIDLLMELKREYNDTIYQIPVRNYQHQYVNELQRERIIEFGNYLYEYELSPSGKTFFYAIHPSDGFSNAKLYKFDLTTGENKLLDDNYRGREIRALSDNEYYYVTKYNGDRFLQLDTALLIRKNLITNEEKVITEVSNDYGRFSRVIDDRMLVVRPWLSEPNSYLVNTTNDELQGVTFNYTMMLEPRRDHIWLGNYKVLQNASLQSFDIINNENFGIIAYDNDVEEIQGIFYDYSLDGFPTFQKLMVYRDGNLLFEEEKFQRKYVSLITGDNHREKPIVLYQQFVDGFKGSRDGFYIYSENEPSGRMILSEPEDFNINFWVGNKSFIAVKLDGLYRFTLP